MNCRYSTGSVSGGGNSPFTNYNFRMIDAASEQSLMDLDLRNYICLSFIIYHQIQGILNSDQVLITTSEYFITIRILLINLLTMINLYSPLSNLHSTLLNAYFIFAKYPNLTFQTVGKLQPCKRLIFLCAERFKIRKVLQNLAAVEEKTFSSFKKYDFSFLSLFITVKFRYS